jgi:hypothetical protein
MRNSYKILVGKPEMNRLIGVSTRDWEDDIVGLEGTKHTDLNWIQVAQDRGQWRILVEMVMIFRVP